MRLLFAAVAALVPLVAHAATVDRQYFPAGAAGPTGVNPPYSAAVLAGPTLYIAGTADGGPKAGMDAATAAKRLRDDVKRTVEASGFTMDDLVWGQIFSSNLSDYADFNEVYRTHCKGPMPARVYLGVDHLLGGAKYEVMGIAVKR